MNITIRNKLDDELKRQLEDISQMAVGEEQTSKAISDFTKLYELALEDDKVELECEKTYQEGLNGHSEQKKERLVKIGIAAAELVLPLMFYGFWLRKGLKFEETGSFTSTTFRGLINRFKPSK